MSNQRVVLDTAAFMDSAQALRIEGAPTTGIQTVVRRFLESAYDDLGKAPRFMDGEDLRAVLLECLPRRFAAKDDLASATTEILGAYFAFLREDQVVTNAFELAQALDEHCEGFVERVASGAAHRDGRLAGKGKTIRHKAERTGRNDPCPCGSGKKFKKCCGT